MTNHFGNLSRRLRGRRAPVAAILVAAVGTAGCGATVSAGNGHTAGTAGVSAGTTSSGRSAATASPDGISPHAIERAYGVSPLLGTGIDGRGETVVLPETTIPPMTAADTNIHQDMAVFDKRYHLPAVKLTISRALGYKGNPAIAEGEEVQDAEMVHTIAPAATIAIMLIPQSVNEHASHYAELIRAAAQRGNIVSYSNNVCDSTSCLSARQLAALNRALRYARDRHVSVFASSGDGGVLSRSLRREVTAPADNPLVTAVGGTTLTVDKDGAYASETAWDEDLGHPTSTGAALSASGGGIATRYPRPNYQNGLPGPGNHRGVPDVAAMSHPGMLSVTVSKGQVGTWAAGGTSESTPLWAGIAALADQDARRQLGFLNDGLYRIGHSAMYHKAFHDITTGSNTVTLPSGKQINGYSTRPGWDLVTGWGSPDAQVLVPLLGKEVHPDDGQRL